MRNVAYPWTRWRVNTHCALTDVPEGWTLSVRVVEPDGICANRKVGEVLTWRDGATATIPTGLMDIRLRKGRHLS